MNRSGPQSMPLACIPDAIEPSARAAHFERIRHLFMAVVEERQPLPDGYAFRFPASSFTELAKFVENERRCCPFLSFALEVPPAEGPVDLRITGPAGTTTFLDSEVPGAR